MLHQPFPSDPNMLALVHFLPLLSLPSQFDKHSV
jgi:hypothetical protein